MSEPALTIQQPWASAIMAGVKRVENRVWRTEYRGPLWIHAGKKADPSAADLLASAGWTVPDDLPHGALLGRVELIDVVPYDPSVEPLFDAYSLVADPLAVGPWCWIVRDLQPLAEPVPMAGKQLLWRVESM